MRSIKMFGLAALAALMAMAFLGAGSAMAESTELCGGDPGTGTTAICPSENEAVTSVHEESVGKAKLLASPEVQCNVLFQSTEVGAAGAPQVIKGHFTYTNCGCTVEEEPGTTAEIKVLRLSHETADVTGNAKIIVECFGIECTYNGTGLVGTAKGPLLSSVSNPNGEVTLNEQEVIGGGFFCPSKGKLDITTTPLVETYIGKGGALHYCVEYKKAGHGYYGVNTCTQASLSTSRNKNFMLVIGPGNPNAWAVGTVKCFRQVPLAHNGLYNSSTCATDVADNSLWEKGEVKTVQ